MEVKRVEIRIVGLISNEEEIDQIQHITKIFVYKQRMKDFMCPIKNKTIVENNILNYKKDENLKKMNSNSATKFNVRGLA